MEIVSEPKQLKGGRWVLNIYKGTGPGVCNAQHRWNPSGCKGKEFALQHICHPTKWPPLDALTGGQYNSVKNHFPVCFLSRLHKMRFIGHPRAHTQLFRHVPGVTASTHNEGLFQFMLFGHVLTWQGFIVWAAPASISKQRISSSPLQWLRIREGSPKTSTVLQLPVPSRFSSAGIICKRLLSYSLRSGGSWGYSKRLQGSGAPLWFWTWGSSSGARSEVIQGWSDSSESPDVWAKSNLKSAQGRQHYKY